MARERQGHAEHFAADQFAAVHSIDETGPKTMALQSAQRRAPDMAAKHRSLAVTKFAQLQQLFADGRNVRVVRTERFAKRDRDSIRNRFRQLGKKTPALVGKDRAPKLIEPDRNDRRIRLPSYDFVTAPQPQQRSCA